MELLNTLADIASGLSFLAGVISNPVKLKIGLIVAVIVMLVAFVITRRVWPSKFAAVSAFLIVLLW